jgi:hypothetical protein
MLYYRRLNNNASGAVFSSRISYILALPIDGSTCLGSTKASYYYEYRRYIGCWLRRFCLALHFFCSMLWRPPTSKPGKFRFVWQNILRCNCKWAKTLSSVAALGQQISNHRWRQFYLFLVTQQEAIRASMVVEPPSGSGLVWSRDERWCICCRIKGQSL